MDKDREWIIKDSADSATVSRLSSELGIDPVLAELLVLRLFPPFTFGPA